MVWTSAYTEMICGSHNTKDLLQSNWGGNEGIHVTITFTAITFIVVIIFTTKICMFGLKLRGKLTHIIEMMTAMTIGMMSGLAVGVVLGGLLKLETFMSTSIAMVIGMTAGAIVGMPLSMVAILEGIMSGIMGGMMGAMLMSEYPFLMSGFVLLLFIGTVLLLQRILKVETGDTGDAESRTIMSRNTLRAIWMAVGTSIVLICSLLLTTFAVSRANPPTQNSSTCSMKFIP